MRNTTILFTRHGETEIGKEQKFEGVLDSSLTERGKEQAQELANICLGKRVQKIYCSPLKRAKQTAEFVSQKLQIPILVRDELKEICYGEFEGKTRKTLEQLPVWKIREKNFFHFVHPGSCLGIPGESYSMLYERLIPFFQSLEKEIETVVVIAHAGVVRFAKKYYDHSTDEELKSFRLGNGEILLFS